MRFERIRGDEVWRGRGGVRMRLALLAALVALAASLGVAPAAGAFTFTVARSDDPVEDPATTACDGTADTCTLRTAITKANTLPGADTINFKAGLTPIAVSAGVLDVTQEVTIDDADGDIEIRRTAGDATLLRLAPAASSSTLRRLTLKHTGGTGALLRIEADGAVVDRVSASGSAGGDGIHVGGSATGVTIGASASSGNAGDGIEITDSARTVTVSDTTASGNTSDGVEVSGSAQSVTITRGAFTGNGEDGIEVTGSASGISVASARVSGNSGNGVAVIGAQDVSVSRSPVFGNSLKPISLSGGANGGIAAPGGFRVGPRRADGSLPVTGSAGVGGTVELFKGDPAGSAEISFLGQLSVAAGELSYLPSPELRPGERVAATLTGSGTSELAVAAVPDDVVSPELVGARALSTTEVLVQPSEPLDPASVQPTDFVLEMAGGQRRIAAASAAPDGSIRLVSAGWKPGEAGFVQLAAPGPGLLADLAGNVNLLAQRLRVAAAPGDFIAPVANRLSIRPRSICLRRGRRCRRPGATIRFLASEEGRAKLVIQRGNRRVGVRTAAAVAGRNRIRFNGTVRGRRLRPGRYRLLVFVEDAVGNETLEPPIQLFSVRRTPVRRKSARRRR